MFTMNDTDYATSSQLEKSLDEPMEETTFITHCAISSIGIVTNFTVIFVFLNDKKLRKKIPNIFIINQVRLILNNGVSILLRKDVIGTFWRVITKTLSHP